MSLADSILFDTATVNFKPIFCCNMYAVHFLMSVLVLNSKYTESSNPQGGDCKALRSPRHGSLVCQEWSKAKVCHLQCHDTFDVAPATFFTNTYICARRTGMWSNRHTVDCTDRQYAVKSELAMYYFFKGNCSHDEEEIKTNFLQSINGSKACPTVLHCIVKNSYVKCGDESGNEDNIYYKDLHNSARQMSRVDNTRKRTQYISLRISVPINSKSSSVSENMEAFKRRLLIIASRISRTSFNASGRVIRTTRVRIRQPLYICKAGFKTGLFHRDTCVPCPKGSYNDRSRDQCSACPRGQYQGKTGQLKCDHCPDGQSTLAIASVDHSSCRELCRAGNYSRTGLEPCDTCPRGTYQTNTNARSCHSCPVGLTTKTEGSISESQCNLCEDGSVHRNGMCYQVEVLNETVNWFDARGICRDKGSYLAFVPHSNDEQFLLDILPPGSKSAYIGLKKDYSHAPGRFKDIMRWDNKFPLTYENWQTSEPDGGSLQHCILMNGTDGWSDIFCGEKVTNQFICMKRSRGYRKLKQSVPILPVSTSAVDFNLLGKCEYGQLMSKIKICDGQRDCKDRSDERECGSSCDVSQYRCQNNRCISYTYYCDGTNDCGDNSDEDTCVLKLCSDREWPCGNGQCIADSKRCDLFSDCLDNTDEIDCDICRGFRCYDGKCIPRSWVRDGIVDCDGFQREDERSGFFINIWLSTTTPLHSTCLREPDAFGKVTLTIPAGVNCSASECPASYYKCPASYCIPVVSVCNEVIDCPLGEDESRCDEFYCPEYYRCQGESNCINPGQYCDGVRHCPRGDDERYCDYHCPSACICHGRVIICDHTFNISTTFPIDVRKLVLSGIAILDGIPDFEDLHYLAVLSISQCGLVTVEGLLPPLPNLFYLNLSENNLRFLSGMSFRNVTKLRYLDLSGNVDLTSVENDTFSVLSELTVLNLQNTSLSILPDNLFLDLSSLLTLNLSYNNMDEITNGLFSGLLSLQYLDIRHNDVKQFRSNIMNDLKSLGKLYTDSYQLCCDSIRPENLDIDNCVSTGSEIASCKNLLGEDILRVMLWCIAVIAMLGNIIVIAYRCKYDRTSLKRSYGVFVTNLSISDCLMGVYMLIIGSADMVYRGRYVSNDYGWRHSSLCKFAGFMSTVSTEASCIFISLITLDRFLAIKFPFGQIRFTTRSTAVTATVTWVAATVIAAVPLSPFLEHWKLYTKNSVCLALPLSSERKFGWQYSAIIFVGFNFILFLLIGLGQILIYREVHSSSKIRTGGSSSDAKVARKLFLVVFTDFLCWFPVGIMGIIALQGYPIGNEVFAWTAVTILPINSALNPILYTLPSMIDAWRLSKKSKEATNFRFTVSKGSNIPDSSLLKGVKMYLGNPTYDMVTLHDILKSRDIRRDVMCDLVSRIVTYLIDLQQENRTFEPVSDQKVFISGHNVNISRVCLSLEPDPGRDSIAEDVFYLNRLMLQLDDDSQGPVTGQSPALTPAEEI